jgi:CheY-like chemotaxis protein
MTLSPIIQTAIETLRPSIEAKNIKLQTCFDFETKTVLADSNRMLQVFWNLISNAVKFTPDGGRVDIELKTETRQIKIIVSDSGQGIEPEFLPYVFDRFRQADGTSTRTHGGLGLGLSIVRHIVELHGGKVEVFSAGVGAGTAFTIFLPVFDVPDAVEERNGDDLENEVFPLLKKPASEVAASESGGDLEGLRVLLIDDEKDTLEMLSAMLRLSGAQVVPQTNVTDALESIKDWIPQIIISDIGMPEMDGYFFIEKLRNLPPEKGGAIPVIALTAYAGVNEQQRVLASGFQMYLSKPVDSSELLGALTALTKKFD